MKTSKAKKYAIEQFLLQNEVIDLLGLNSPDGFYLCEVDENSELQEQIMKLVPEIRKYFCHVNITGLLYPERCKRPWLSIVRGILRGRYNLKYRACRHHPSSRPNESVFTMRYFLEPVEKTTKPRNGQLTLNIRFSKSDASLSKKKTLQLRKKESDPTTRFFNKKMAHEPQHQLPMGTVNA